MDKELLKMVEETFLIRKIKDVREISTGNINSTYLVEAEGGIRYILQKINKFVFTKPEQVMQNIRRVSRYIEKKVVYEGGDASREVLHPINTLDGTRFMVDNNEQYWRMYNCIENAKTYDTIDNEDIFYEVGHAFGTFQKRLADYPEIQQDYMFEQMLRQYVMIYLAEGQFNMFKLGDEEFLDLDPVKAAEKVIDKVEEIYYAGVNR